MLFLHKISDLYDKIKIKHKNSNTITKIILILVLCYLNDSDISRKHKKYVVKSIIDEFFLDWEREIFPIHIKL